MDLALPDVSACRKRFSKDSMSSVTGARGLYILSGLWIRIRINLSCWIRILNADPDPDQGGQKLPTNIE
jgi:hypothetical protein